MLNLELDILDTVKYSGSMLCVEQLKGSENSLFFYAEILAPPPPCDPAGFCAICTILRFLTAKVCAKSQRKKS